jgi:hypothetical protein
VNRFDVIESLEGRTYFSPLKFAPAVSFPTGTNPSDVVAADLTGNGISDVITTDFGSASIAILRGNGNGTFQAPVFYPVGNSPEQLAVADLNGDGIPDIVTVNEGDNTISVLMGNGDGTFQPAVTYGVGVRPEAIAVGDLTGNGAQDVVVADDGSADVDVLINNGNGTFQPPVSYAAGDDPDGVAVGDFNGDERPDIVVINPLGSYLHVLLNNGDGTFKAPVTYTTGQTPRAVAVADLNSDGRPDIITTSLHDTTIDYLQGIGDGTFDSVVSYPTGYFPFSMAIADINGDGRLDVVTSNELDNTVSVLLHTGTGTFLPLVGYHAGQAPVAVSTADLNGDGKPDIITADFNTNSISVLMNQTNFPQLIPTTITLTANQNPVEVGNRVVLTAQVSPASVTGRRPIGVVQFFDGDAVLGVGAISAAGIATIDPTKLTLGTHTITAHYAGDGKYEQVLSGAISEEVVEPIQTTPLVQVSGVTVHLAKEYVPGDNGVADVDITDIGDGVAKGTVGLQLFASTSTTFDSNAFPLRIDSHSTVGLNLLGGRTAVVPVTFTLPTTIEPVNYTIFAAVTPATCLTASQVVTVPAVGLTSSVAVLEFGKVPTHGNYKLTRALSNGSTITLSLTGPGTGAVTEDADGGISITLSNTAGYGAFSITGGPVTLDYLADNSPIGQINAATASMAGQLSLNGSTGQLTLAGAVNSNLFVAGGSKQIAFSLGTVTSSSLYCAGAIRSLAVATWSNTPADAITTAVVGTITSAGDFGPALFVNGGIGPRDLSIASATIGGTVGAAWSIQRNVGSLQLANVGADWSGSIHGKLFSLIDSGDFSGNLAAQNIGSLDVAGNLTDANILTGANFGTTATLSPTGDFFGRGVLSSLLISGSVTNSVVAAGLSPVGDSLLGPGSTLLRNSAIQSITVSGAVDDASKFLAVSLPVKATVDGIVVATATDSTFHL